MIDVPTLDALGDRTARRVVLALHAGPTAAAELATTTRQDLGPLLRLLARLVHAELVELVPVGRDVGFQLRATGFVEARRAVEALAGNGSPAEGVSKP
ncbi:MAG: hypothetical protein H6736_12150 [Alphaproteobacteria bacterium]|nr:hypothetical protein [Alphaproteobacteria bacterium]MCB9692556.1 hypothetical protein [Alphaproteobacteria bacterium]